MQALLEPFGVHLQPILTINPSLLSWSHLCSVSEQKSLLLSHVATCRSPPVLQTSARQSLAQRRLVCSAIHAALATAAPSMAHVLSDRRLLLSSRLLSTAYALQGSASSRTSKLITSTHWAETVHICDTPRGRPKVKWSTLDPQLQACLDMPKGQGTVH